MLCHSSQIIQIKFKYRQINKKYSAGMKLNTHLTTYDFSLLSSLLLSQHFTLLLLHLPLLLQLPVYEILFVL